jgi:anaerobic sulfite reductase subunit B
MAIQSLAETRADALMPLPQRVLWRRDEAPGVVTFGLRPEATPVPPSPGQFNMLYAFGVGEVPISVSGTPDGDGELVHTVRDVGATSRALCAVQAGDTIGVRGPFGTRWDVESAAGEDLVVVAGGIGLAPLRPAIVEVLRSRARFGRLCLVAGARTPQDLLFLDDLQTWRRDGVELRRTVDRGDPAWREGVGVVTQELARVRLDPRRTVALLCGPEVMMRATAGALVDRGVSPDRIRVSLERSMQCGVGLCGHCQLGPLFVCVDGPVLSWDRAEPLLRVREL